MSLATDLITVDDLADYLKWSAAQKTANATKAARFISAATVPIEFLTGPVVAASRDEWHDGGFYRIILDKTPVVAISLVTEAWGANTVHTLTEQPLDGSTSGNAYGYTIDKASGVLTRRSIGREVSFVRGRGNVHVQYQAGYCVDTGSVPTSIAQAALVAIADNWQVEQGGNRVRPSDAEGSTVKGYFLPGEALEMLAPYRDQPGIY